MVSLAAGQRKRRLICAAGVLTILCVALPGLCFAQPRQEPLGAERERSGEAWHTSAAGMGNFTLTREEKRLLTEISSAGKDRNWMAAKYLFDTYTGDAPPVYSAALHAAFTCREYREGARLYEQCRQRCKYINEPVYVDALRIFGKLREDDMVCKVWDEVLQKSDLNVVLASARIAAAADAGDPETAEKVLDLMEKKGIPINVLHMSSAIRACWGWGKDRHKAAKYFFDLCPQVGVTPNLIVFTCLIGAYKTAPLEDLTSTYHAMRGLNITPNEAFVETYLLSVVAEDNVIKWYNPESAAEFLSHRPLERLKAAQEALSDFDRDGVKLTRLSRNVKEALDTLGI